MKRITSLLFIILLLCATLCGCTEDNMSQNSNTLDHAEEASFEFTTIETYTTEESATTETIATETITTEIITTAPHIHTWQDATCTEAKTCTECGENQGKALGHTWKDATCTSPKTCTSCQTTSGYSLGHNYSGKSCTRCYHDNPNYSEPQVWIPTNGGTKYHTYSGCSNMKNPEQVSKSYAISMGFESCKRCH